MTAAALKAPSIPVERHELSCGATLLASRREGAPVCALEVHLRGGHSLDPDGKHGVALLTGRLCDRGTELRTEEQLALALETAGGSLAGGSTGVLGSIAGDGWRVLLETAAEVVTSPSYPRERFERERKRLLDRLVVDRDEPRVQASESFRRLVYGSHWLGRSEQGTVETVQRIRRDDLVRFHRRNWVASRAVIAFCGDVEPRRVRSVLERALAAWPTGRPLPPPSLDFPRPAQRVEAFAARRQQVHVYLGHLGIRRTDPDYPALLVMDHVLGTGPGFTNRIAARLRDELGLAYTVHASITGSAGVLPGTFSAYIGTSPEHVETAVEGFQREIRRIRQRLVDPAELDLAKSYLTGAFSLGFERAARRAGHLVFSHRCGLGENHLAELLERVSEVTREELRAAARRHLLSEASCLAAGGPVTASRLRRALRASGRR